VVEAHHLSSELNSIWRATTASLNASLLGNTQDFLDAVETMLAARGVACPVMIVRGDGSLVRADFARRRPVEIVHSGPATSAAGGYFLGQERVAALTGAAARAVVVDMGGTTTDLAVIERGRPQILDKGATVGRFQTCIHTIRARSFGLGGDSRIVFDHWGRLEIGPERALPISYLCSQYPRAKTDLAAALRRRLLYSENLEFWLLRRLPAQPLGSDLAARIIDALKDGPQMYAGLRKRVGTIPPFVLRELVEREVLERAALTPTDLLHVSGEYAPWDVECACALVDAAARLWDESGQAFLGRARALMTRRMVSEIVQFLSGETLPDPVRTGFSEKSRGMARWLFDEALTGDDPLLGSRIFVKAPLVGIGAPARAFLPPVAEALGAELILPKYYEVANAIGAVAGSVICQAEAEVLPWMEGAGQFGYFARVANTQQAFPHFEDAVAHARAELAEQVRLLAEAAGAEHPVVEIQATQIWDGMLRLTATAIGGVGEG
jgi:N-methylhydantoinase A/oxoprolinase/acetone carboxylase beta subunit